MENIFLSQIADYITIISGVMTIIGISGVISWSINKHLKNIFANRVYLISIQIFKVGLSLFYLFLLYLCWEFCYENILVAAKGSLDYRLLFWDTGQPLPYIISYGITIPIFIFLFIIGLLCILSGTLSPIKNIRKVWRNSNIDLSINNKLDIKIISAEFGKNETFKDVTNIVSQFLKNDKLEFIVDNKLLGDPLPNVPKILKLIIQMNGITQNYEYAEGNKVEIKSNQP